MSKLIENNQLLYRRQFVLGPSYLDSMTGWKRFDLNNELFLTVHPDLNVVQSVNGNWSITLLGYILDPFAPDASDQDIINALIASLKSECHIDSVFEKTETFGGRWILVVDNGTDTLLFHDPSGYRQVFYTDMACCKSLWCASQTGLLSDFLQLEMDDQALDFMKAKFRDDRQYWWPVDTSPYREIKRLLPNYYLNLKTGEKKRYWPNKPLAVKTFDEVISKNKALLKGLMQSAANRFELAISITSGKDTRLVLAATRDINRKSLHYTSQFWEMHDNHADLLIASRLMSRLGRDHRVLKSPKSMTYDFAELYYRNVETARGVYGVIAEAFFNGYPPEWVAVKGNAIVSARPLHREKLRQRGIPDSKNITVDDLVLISRLGEFNMSDSVFAKEAYERWLSEIKNIHNVDVLNLFYWEDREGSWQAMNMLEWDLVQEVFVPFNCRAFLVNMLSIDEKYRQAPDFLFHMKMIRDMWPELLKEPVNPRLDPEYPHRSLVLLSVKNFIEKIRIDQWIPRKIRSLGRSFIMKKPD